MLQIGSVLDGKYKILSEIGHGGMSVVYMALNEKANKTWAVKEIRKDGRMDFNVVKQGLVAEIETLKRLKHPNLPSIVDVIEDEDSFIIVMDYIEGKSLDNTLAEHGAQPQENVIEWAEQLCDVLGYLHSCNPPIIYRDMKPANIMLKPDGNITLIDFGTAKTYDVDLGQTTGIGTIGYAAPEQFINSGMGRTDARTDIYCLGMTLYHLLTGVDPCKNVLESRSIRAVNPMLSPGLDAIILKCTERLPQDRYQSCAELLYDLEHQEEMTVPYRKRQLKKLTVFLVCVALSILMAVASVAFFVAASGKRAENYGLYIEKAADPSISQKEREDLYMKAIEDDPTKKDAYIDLVNLFLNSTNNGIAFEKTEAAKIVKLNAGVDTEGKNGYLTTIYPFEQLKKSDPNGYAEVCNDIGLAYWYDYEVESERYSLATEWFEKAAEKYPLAQVFCDIGKCKIEIAKYRDQKRTEKMYAAYDVLWTKTKDLVKNAGTLDDNDIKILVWNETINNIYSEIQYFLVNISESDIYGLLDEIILNAEDLKKTTSLSEVKSLLDEVILNADVAKQRTREAVAARRGDR